MVAREREQVEEASEVQTGARGRLEVQIWVFRGGQFSRPVIDLLGCPAARIRPAPGDGQMALRAAAVFEPVLLHIVPGAANQQRLARLAHRVRPVAVDVPLIHVVQPNLERDLSGPMQVSGGVRGLSRNLKSG